MADKRIAIKVDGVSKNFKLPHEKIDSLKSAFINPFRAKRDTKIEVQHALKNVSFEVYEGEFFGIVGRNGSGKSTLLKLLAEIYRPTKGKVSTQGKLVPFIELGVGFNPELTGRENVYLNGALLGFSKKEIDAMYDDIVDFAELGNFMDQKLKNYSSGMQVRLAFSVATRSKADILLIDEVLAVGDADFQRKCFNYFKELKRSNTTVVFVTHDMEAVREYCDRAMLIEQSEIKELGSTTVVAKAYSQLFMKGGSTAQGDGAARWGSRTAYLRNVGVDIDEKNIKIALEITAEKDVEDPILGIRIASRDGREITGTNTKIEGVKLGSIRKGEKVSYQFIVPNVMSDGAYMIDPALLDQDGITVYDWWNGAAQFEIKKERRLPYMIDPGFKIEKIHD